VAEFRFLSVPLFDINHWTVRHMTGPVLA